VLPANSVLVAGTKTFAGVTLVTAGNQTITGTDTVSPGITGTTAAVVVNPAGAKTLVVSGIPNPISAGNPSNFTVKAIDAFNNTATGYLGIIHFTSNDGLATLPGNHTFTVGDAGVHNFTAGSGGQVTFGTAGPAQTLTATDTVTSTITGTQTVTVTAVTDTIFVSGLPGPYTAGTLSNVTVDVKDGGGNPVTNYTGTVHFTATDAQATLPADYTFTLGDAGHHVFSGASQVTLRTQGSATVTVAQTSALPSPAPVTGSQTVSVIPGPASQIAFIVSPTNTAPNAVMSPVVVQLEDSSGNAVTGQSDTISLQIGTNPGGGTLLGGGVLPTTSGQVTFSNLSINALGLGYTLQAVSHSLGLGTFTSGGFNVSGAGVAAKLAFVVQPATYTVNQLMRPPYITVEVQDTAGMAIVSASPQVTLALANNPTGAVLNGQLQTQSFNNNGDASWTTLAMNLVGNGYTLQATANGLNPATSNPFSIAATPDWSQVSSGVMNGGDVNQLALDTSGPTLYAATAFGIWKSTTGGSGAWTNITNNVFDTAFESIAVDLKSATKDLYVLSQNTGLWKLTHPSVSTVWTQVNVNNGGVNAFALDPTVAQKLYVLNGNQIEVSTNGGATFNNPGSAGLPNNGNADVIVVDPKTPATIYAAYQGQGIYQSTDSGATFTAINSGLTDMNVVAIAVDPKNDGNVYAGTENGGLCVSTNAGGSWAGSTNGLSSSAQISAIQIDPQTPSTLYVTTSQNHGGGPGSSAVFRSTDTAGSWTNIAGTTLPAFLSNVSTILLDPSSGNPATTMYGCVQGSGTFKTVTAPSGSPPVWAGFNSGMPNPGPNDVVVDPVNDGNVYVTDDTRIFLSSNGGATWALATTPPPSIGVAAGIAVDPAGGSNVYLGTDLGVFKSTDRGVTWSSSPATNTGGIYPLFPTVDPNNATILYVGQFAGNGTILTSIDSGATFTATSLGGAFAGYQIGQIVCDPSSLGAGRSQTLYAFGKSNSSGSGIIKSTDAGATWSDTGLSNPNGDFGRLLAVDGASPASVFFADKQNGVFKLTGGTGAWASVTNGLPAETSARSTAWASGAGSSATLYIATSSNNSNSQGIWKTTNGGASWFPDTNGLTFYTGNATIATDKATPTTVYAALDGGGLWKATLGAAFQVAFAQNPTNAQNGAVLSPNVTVAVLDENGNLVLTPTSVTVALGNNPGGSVLGGTLTQPSSGGFATFNDLTLTNTGTGYTLVATASGLASGTSTPFTIFGPPTQLAFVTQPTNTLTGATVSPSVQVAVEDAQGNVVTTASTSITLTITVDPSGGASITGGGPVAVSQGIATFNALEITSGAGSGVGFKLKAANGGAQTAATSGAFNVFGAASQLVITSPPTAGVAGVPAPSFQVTVEDANGTPVSTSSASISVIVNSGPSGVINGTNPVTAINGVATFSNLEYNTSGSYTVVATSLPLAATSASSPFNIVPGAPTQLAFMTQPPASSNGGQVLSPAPVVQLLDATGNVCTNATSPVLMTLGSGPAGSSLSGITFVAPVGGSATFSSLSLGTAGTYSLLAQLPGANSFGPPIAATVSNNIVVTAGAAVLKAVFQVSPGNGAAGTALPSFTVALVDAGGNVVNAGGSVSLGFGQNPTSATLGGTTSGTLSNGTFTFNTVTVSNTGGPYTLTATVAGSPQAQSASFNIAGGGVPAALRVTQQPPASTQVGVVFPIQVTIVDSSGATCTTANNQINLTGSKALVGGSLSVTAVNGVATFGSVGPQQTGSQTLTATCIGLTSAVSNSFNPVNASGSPQLAFVATPGAAGFGFIFPATLGQTLTPAPSVAWTDSFGNVITSLNTPITLNLFFNNGMVLNNNTVTPTNGVATFNNLNISSQTGSNQLFAMSGVTTSGSYPTNGNMVVGTLGVATQLAFVGISTEETLAKTPFTTAPTIAVQDLYGNTIINSPQTITVSLQPSNGATLSGGLTQTTVNGVATFSNLSVDLAGSYGLSGQTAQFLNTQQNLSLTIDAWAAANTGMDGGSLSSVAVNPASPSIVYAASSSNGIWKTTNAGALWSPIGGQNLVGQQPAAGTGVLSNGNFGGSHLAVDPATPTTVWLVSTNAAGSFNGQPSTQVYKSSDGGATWFSAGGTGDGVADKNGFSPFLSAIAIDPAATTTVYVGGSDQNGAPALYKTLDGGVSWTDASAGILSVLISSNDRIQSMVVDGNGALYLGTLNNGVLLSLDGAITWTTKPIAGTENVPSLAVDGSNNVYAATSSEGVWRAAGTGNAFVADNNTGLPNNALVVSVVVDPGNSNAVFCGTQDGLAYVTANQGGNWSLMTGLPGTMPVQSLQVASDHSVWCAVTTEGFNGTPVGRGAFHAATTTFASASTGLKASNMRAIAVDPNNSQNLVAGGDGLYYSTNGGTSWTLATGMPAAPVNAVAYDKQIAGVVFAGFSNSSGGIVFRSSNGGQTWSVATTNLGGSNGNAFAVDLTTGPSTIYVVTDQGAFSASDTGIGLTWNLANTGMTISAQHNYASIVIDPTTGGASARLYASDVGSGMSGPQDPVLTTANAGGSWVPADGGITFQAVATLAIDPFATGTLYAAEGNNGFGGGVFKTTNFGVSWSSVNAGLFSSPNVVVLDPTNDSVLYCNANGVSKTTDAGTQWVGAGNGVGNNVNGIAIDPTTSLNVYAGTGSGVFKTTSGGQ
jgi:hypothetical protein